MQSKYLYVVKKYYKEIIVTIFQLLMFYLFPLTAGPTDAIGLVVIIIYSTNILSIIIGAVSNNKIKYWYPIIVSVLFIPSVFIYYNETALVHAIWYCIDSSIGLIVGLGIRKIALFIKKKRNRGNLK